MNKKKIKNFFTKNKKKIYEEINLSENKLFIKELEKIRKNAIFEKEILEIEFHTKKIKMSFKFNILINPLFKGKKENLSQRINLKKYKVKKKISLIREECYCKFILLEKEFEKLKNNIYIDYLRSENKYYTYYNLEKTFFKFCQDSFILDCYIVKKKKYKEIFSLKTNLIINLKRPGEIISKINNNKKMFGKLTNDIKDLELEETFLDNEINNLKNNFDEKIESSLKMKKEELLNEFNKIIKKKIKKELDIEEKTEDKLIIIEKITEKLMIKNELLFELIEKYNNLILKEFELNKIFQIMSEKIKIIKNKFPKIFSQKNFFKEKSKLKIPGNFFCSICYTKVCNIVNLDCFHLVSCDKCFKKGQCIYNKCFLCKKIIKGFLYFDF